MSFFGLFGHDKNPAASTGPIINLPKAPPAAFAAGGGFQLPGLPGVAQVPSQAQQLPSAPPSAKKPSLWDDQHRKDTLLAISAGILSGDNFAEGMGSVAKNLLAQRQALRQEGRPQLGGPDDAFEVYTDPETGEHVFKPIQAAIDYQERKRIKAKDVADINGRVMYAISQLPQEERAAAYADVRSNPEYYGVDVDNLPASWNDTYGTVAGNMGMTVSQAMTRGQAATNEANREVHRDAADADRAERTGIYRNRAAASTAQGEARIGIAREALDVRKTSGGGKGGRARKQAVSTMSTTDLLSIALGK